MADIMSVVDQWLDTFTSVRHLEEKPEALAKEMETIAAVFKRENCVKAEIDATFEHIKMTSQSRAWPTPATVYEALRHIKRKDRGEAEIGAQRGDRLTVNGSELATLDEQVIP